MVSCVVVSGRVRAFEYTGPGFMLSSLTLARRPGPRWPSRLLAVILSLDPGLGALHLKAQTDEPAGDFLARR